MITSVGSTMTVGCTVVGTNDNDPSHHAPLQPAPVLRLVLVGERKRLARVRIEEPPSGAETGCIPDEIRSSGISGVTAQSNTTVLFP
jgi:hypothetical protein